MTSNVNRYCPVCDDTVEFTMEDIPYKNLTRVKIYKCKTCGWIEHDEYDVMPKE